MAAPTPRHIVLRTQELDPTREVNYLEKPGFAPSATIEAPKKKELFLVQFAQTPTNALLAGLERRGLRVMQAVRGGAYLVYGHRSALPSAQTARELNWAGSFPVSEKFDPAVRQQQQTAVSEPMPVIVQYFEDADAEATVQSLRKLARRAFESSRVGSHYTARLEVDPKDLDAIASLPLVFNIERQPQYELHGERQAMIVATLTDPTLPGVPPPSTGNRYADFLSRKGVSGEGVTVQILDDGLDTGDASNAPGTAHVDILGRIAGIFNYTTDFSGQCVAGHGTINAGIIMGQPKAGASMVDGIMLGRSDDQGFQFGQGIAPQARILAGKVFRDSGAFDIGLRMTADLAADGVQNQAAIQSNSWGANLNGAYSAESRDFDFLVRDANSQAAGDQPLVIVFSAGNEGDNTVNRRGTIGAPASAKNVIAVGASENSDATGADGCAMGPSASDNASQLATFSSRGPTDDGRIGVTLVAPGTHVYGIAPSIADFDGSGVCGGPGNNGILPNTDAYWPAGQTDYTWSSGTSHSAPAVSGAAALFVEWYRKEFDRTPSPAMVKAALVNSATAIPGDLTHPTEPLQHVPNVDVGWGRLNLEGLLPNEGQVRPLFIVDQEQVLSDSGQEFEYDLAATGQNQPLKITLAWTDVPGLAGVSPNLINDLDLRVVQGDGQVFLGNRFVEGVSATGGSPDRLETLENVFIPNASGIYRVQVIAHSLAGNGVPSHNGAIDQDFALYASGVMTETPKGSITLDRDIYAPDGRVRIRVSDLDLRGQASTQATVRSEVELEKAVQLAPVFEGSGLFEAMIQLKNEPPAGATELLVAHGSTITATYQDADDGSGNAAVATDTATVDGMAPVISNLRILDTNTSWARVAFTTDENTSATVGFGPACDDFDRVVSRSRRLKNHNLLMDQLEPDTVYSLRVTVSDAVANRSQSTCLAFRTDKRICSQAYRMESGDEAPFVKSSSNPNYSWNIGGSPYAIGTKAWLAPAPSSFADIQLVLPSQGILPPRASLLFNHTYAFESGYDGGVVEYTDDGGQTWKDLGPYLIRGGYNSVLKTTQNPLSGRNAWTGGQQAPVTLVEADLSTFAGLEIGFRWRVGTDNLQGASGWLLDDIRICSSVGSRGRISIASDVYRTGQDARISLTDADLAGQSIAWVQVQSTSETVPESIKLKSIGAGQFLGTVRVTASLTQGDRRIGVRHNDVITATYADSDDGTGAMNVVSDTATADLEGVALLSSGPRDIFSRVANYSLKTAEPAEVKVIVESQRDGRSWTYQASAVTEWQVSLHDLTPCAPHKITVTTTDPIGNVRTFTGAGPRYVFNTLNDQVVLEQDAENGNGGWGTGASVGFTDWAIGVDGFAHSPVNSWQATDPSYRSLKWLQSPVFDIDNATMLSFWHTYEFEAIGESFFDGGVVQISGDGGATWQSLESGFRYGTAYDGALSEAYDNPLGALKAFSAGMIGPMKPAYIDLGAWAGSGRTIRFAIGSDDSAGAAGWFIDSIRIVRQFPCIKTGTSGAWQIYE